MFFDFLGLGLGLIEWLRRAVEEQRFPCAVDRATLGDVQGGGFGSDGLACRDVGLQISANQTGATSAALLHRFLAVSALDSLMKDVGLLRVLQGRVGGKDRTGAR